jgi:hypothetical protein
MFVTHEVAVQAPYDVVVTRLRHLNSRSTIHRLSETAYDVGIEDVLRVGPLGDRCGLTKLVRIRTLDPVSRGTTTAVGLRWEATGPAGDLFPILDADIVLTADGPGRSRLGLSGSYRPPLGRVGATLDKMVMNRIAAATVRSLLDRVADALDDPAASPERDPVVVPRWWPVIQVTGLR